MKEKMEFLNQLGNKIGKKATEAYKVTKVKATETYKATKEKVSDISDELKAKGKISTLEDEVFELYAEIGEMVYNELKDGKDVSRDLVLEKCEKISGKKDEISKLEAEIAELKKD